MNHLLFSLGMSLALSAPAFADTAPRVFRDAEQAFLERTSLQAADEKCGYFTDLERAALTSGQLQARGTLLRAGFTPEDLNLAAEEVARYANTRECGNADFMQAAGYLRDAFSAFVGTMVMNFPGRDADWNASRSRWDTWRIVQDGSTPDYLFQFGLLAPPIGDPDDFPASFSRPLDNPLIEEPFDLAVDLFLTEQDVEPSTARLLIRNPDRASEPWLGAVFADEPGPPPRAVTRSYWPASREVIVDEDTEERRMRFTFSDEATEALMSLDPRERVEILIQPNPRTGETEPRVLTVEVGDFTAAYYFSRLPAL
ncbi:hypothetical protein [Ponticaulis sp.]|uniref:hypothetical protein n=1 Tax=Ponticaulis sp. TaxID=2020902 RepID=UPI000B64C710|nr:hypothetical protein [Ponticaulis sp.]MAI90322.1 hypothetical protein [Ponticaulis sp.]OUX99960.1 MAG: hypothetical protein CBB65_07770 [Hyphomonadaceae bacterium TMED5]|tara:strand:- start:299490 stop:300428 length:939 start_codon:yes stop_codon:yes gene_type:complete